jgi:hypothetical protein
MNGTSRKDLQEGYSNAALELENFIDAWSRIEFNARDYYVVDGAWTKARDERDAMNAKLRELREYLQAMQEHLYA